MLQDEIKKKSSEIYKESYQMSIGELANLYRDEEIDVHPEFQRLYRWSDYQKTKLIESVMLNIPIPQIYVSQNEEGVWDVIDGVQRLSTIFQFMGILKDDEGKKIEPLTLLGTKDLPSFEGMKWKNKENKDLEFTREQQLEFKRSRIDVTILKKASDSKAKYELTKNYSLVLYTVISDLLQMTNMLLQYFLSFLPNEHRVLQFQILKQYFLQILLPQKYYFLLPIIPFFSKTFLYQHNLVVHLLYEFSFLKILFPPF